MADPPEKSRLGRVTLSIACVVILAVVAVAGLRFSIDTSPPPPPKHYLSLIVQEKDVVVAANATDPNGPGVVYHAWTYNGTMPGPVLRVRQGDIVNFTLTNAADSTMGHSIDFHAAKVAANLYYKTISPGQTFSFEFQADYPGVFMYHCGTPPVLEHIGKGLYGMIIVDPKDPLPPVDQEFFIVQSEIYDNMTAMMNKDPTYVVFNGYQNKYVREPIDVKVGEEIRVYFLDAGPSLWSAFHVIGTVFDRVYVDGNPKNLLYGLQTANVPPSGAVIADFNFAMAGKNPFVTHAFADASKGAVGVFNVTGEEVSPPPPVTGTATVHIVPGAFQKTTDAFNPNPIVVTIGVNNTVVWVNDDSMMHTATSDTGAWDTGDILPGQSASITFTTPGTYTYHCSPHPTMVGTVIVQEMSH